MGSKAMVAESWCGATAFSVRRRWMICLVSISDACLLWASKCSNSVWPKRTSTESRAAIKVADKTCNLRDLAREPIFGHKITLAYAHTASVVVLGCEPKVRLMHGEPDGWNGPTLLATFTDAYIGILNMLTSADV